MWYSIQTCYIAKAQTVSPVPALEKCQVPKKTTELALVE